LTSLEKSYKICCDLLGQLKHALRYRISTVVIWNAQEIVCYLSHALVIIHNKKYVMCHKVLRTIVCEYAINLLLVLCEIKLGGVAFTKIRNLVTKERISWWILSLF
jgi:hypothetical protein